MQLFTGGRHLCSLPVVEVALRFWPRLAVGLPGPSDERALAFGSVACRWALRLVAHGVWAWFPLPFQAWAVGGVCRAGHCVVRQERTLVALFAGSGYLLYRVLSVFLQRVLLCDIARA